MVLEYKKKGRISGTGSSPRDLQRRQFYSVDDNLKSKVVIDLLETVTSMGVEIENLKRERTKVHPATSVSSDKKYTEEEFNEELIKALEKEFSNNSEVNSLKQEVGHLKSLLSTKEDLINALKNIPSVESSTSNEKVIKADKRPTMENSFVDPTENKGRLDPHINVKEIKDNKKDMADKVDKLKELFGGK